MNLLLTIQKLLLKLTLLCTAFGICFILYAAIISNDEPYKVIKEIPVKATNFVTDNLGNVYCIHKDELIKYTSKLEYFNRYSNKSFGTISAIDATNPLKVLLLYNEVNAISFLDNMLGKSTSDIMLQEMGMGPSSLACISYNNGFWLYNPINFELRRYDEQLTTTTNAVNLNQVLGFEFHPDFMQEEENWLYVNDPSVGILIFDIYGAYSKNIPFKGLSYFQVRGQQLYFRQKNNFIAYNMKTLKTDTIPLPENTVKAWLNKNYLYVLTPDKLSQMQVGN